MEPVEDQEVTPLDDHEVALAWLNVANRIEPAPTRDEIFAPDYFYSVDLGGDWRQKNVHVVFEPANTYENWLAHGAIPQCFRHFISDLRYMGRAELALYVRLVLLMDHNGIYYGPQEELREGLFGQAKQVGPVLKQLANKHLVLVSPGEVAIPWQRGQLRRIYQRPRAAYTIARLHYVGFEDEVFEPGTRKLIERKREYLDRETFKRCVQTLAHAYRRRAVAGVDRPALSQDLVSEWLFRTFLSETEREALRGRVDDHFLHRAAPGGQTRSRKEAGRGRRSTFGVRQ